ncbi:hypothetical protein C8Q79DRAFT_428483 [Trametes meyenii]|nr:hypothetical protein C8Q79DRAFT_428483 [Trametes meyenii]
MGFFIIPLIPIAVWAASAIGAGAGAAYLSYRNYRREQTILDPEPHEPEPQPAPIRVITAAQAAAAGCVTPALDQADALLADVPMNWQLRNLVLAYLMRARAAVAATIVGVPWAPVADLAQLADQQMLAIRPYITDPTTGEVFTGLSPLRQIIVELTERIWHDYIDEMQRQ